MCGLRTEELRNDEPSISYMHGEGVGFRQNRRTTRHSAFRTPHSALPMTSPLHITVMLGGPSAEREVSLRTGTAAARALRSLGHHVTELDPKDPSAWTLPAHTDVVFLALHGTYGEDGAVQRQ